MWRACCLREYQSGLAFLPCSSAATAEDEVGVADVAVLLGVRGGDAGDEVVQAAADVAEGDEEKGERGEDDVVPTAGDDRVINVRAWQVPPELCIGLVVQPRLEGR